MLNVGHEAFGRLSSVLCLGAHCDDIVFSSDERRAAEARAGAEAFLAGAGEVSVRIEDFRGRYFPYLAEIKEYFDALGAELSPDVVFTHLADDLHQDHRVLSELALNTFREHLILEYEIPKFDGDFSRPNVYVQLDESQCKRKVDTICRVYESQADKHWFSAETFRATLRLRGIECKSPSGYAEAFQCRKLVLA
jgi:LmbE family N-acetylglucosaminyl deacetylase